MNTNKNVIPDTIYIAIINYKNKLINERKNLLDKRSKELKVLEVTLKSLLEHMENREQANSYIEKTLTGLREEFISDILWYTKHIETIDTFITNNIFENKFDDLSYIQ